MATQIETSEPGNKRSRSLHMVSFILSFSIGWFGYLMPVLGNFTMIPGDMGDARFNSVVLEHGYQWLTGKTAQLWSPSFFYPYERVLGLSDNHFGSVWIYSTLRGFGLPREMAYSGWYVFGFLLNFIACGWVLRQAKFSPLASALGAFVFTFALPVLHQEGHAQLVYRFAIPMACFCWYRALVRRDLMSAAQAIFWCALQFMCAVYLGVFLAYCLAAMLLAFLLICQLHSYCTVLAVRYQFDNYGHNVQNFFRLNKLSRTPHFIPKTKLHQLHFRSELAASKEAL